MKKSGLLVVIVVFALVSFVSAAAAVELHTYADVLALGGTQTEDLSNGSILVQNTTAVAVVTADVLVMSGSSEYQANGTQIPEGSELRVWLVARDQGGYGQPANSYADVLANASDYTWLEDGGLVAYTTTDLLVPDHVIAVAGQEGNVAAGYTVPAHSKHYWLFRVIPAAQAASLAAIDLTDYSVMQEVGQDVRKMDSGYNLVSDRDLRVADYTIVKCGSETPLHTGDVVARGSELNIQFRPRPTGTGTLVYTKSDLEAVGEITQEVSGGYVIELTRDIKKTSWLAVDFGTDLEDGWVIPAGSKGWVHFGLVPASEGDEVEATTIQYQSDLESAAQAAVTANSDGSFSLTVGQPIRATSYTAILAGSDQELEYGAVVLEGNTVRVWLMPRSDATGRTITTYAELKEISSSYVEKSGGATVTLSENLTVTDNVTVAMRNFDGLDGNPERVPTGYTLVAGTRAWVKLEIITPANPEPTTPTEPEPAPTPTVVNPVITDPQSAPDPEPAPETPVNDEQPTDDPQPIVVVDDESLEPETPPTDAAEEPEVATDDNGAIIEIEEESEVELEAEVVEETPVAEGITNIVTLKRYGLLVRRDNRVQYDYHASQDVVISTDVLLAINASGDQVSWLQASHDYMVADRQQLLTFKVVSSADLTVIADHKVGISLSDDYNVEISGTQGILVGYRLTTVSDWTVGRGNFVLSYYGRRLYLSGSIVPANVDIIVAIDGDVVSETMSEIDEPVEPEVVSGDVHHGGSGGGGGCDSGFGSVGLMLTALLLLAQRRFGK